jgi:ribosome recycling factor
MEGLDDVLLEAADKMDKSLDFLHGELSGLRTGKASPGMVEHITVDYYGSPTRLREIANLATPEPRLLVINPYDPSSIAAIEKAILAANIGITPVNDGRVIRVPVPELSEERRKEMVKVARRMGEEARVAVRNVRREANEAVKALQRDSRITEDLRESGLADIQKMTDEAIAKIDEALASKETEVMAV